MGKLLYLPLFATALVISGAANGDSEAPRKLAQAPPHESIAPCLTRDISTLSAESDFSDYMAATCPSDVRIKALRRLWRLMPPPSGPDRDFGEDW
jgi:hypothetical protein